MISHQHRFIFIHIPKTAGTSIETALRDGSCRLLPGEWDHGRVPHTPLNHLTLQELVDYDLLTPAQLKSYFKFCFVRNPWDRLVSEIFCPWMAPWFKDMTVEQRLRRACDLAATSQGIGNHLRLQHDFLSADGLQMDFIGQFEHLEADFNRICRLLGLEVNLPHLNRSAHRSYQAYYDAETQALAAAAYRPDIEAFQYKFEAATGARVDVQKSPRPVDKPVRELGEKRKITAYPLVDPAVPLQPAAEQWSQLGPKSTPNLNYANSDRAEVARPGWQLRCPVAFTATWNGGPKAEDIDIRWEGAEADQPAFVQSHLGQGRLTFYPGYQFKTEAEHLLWVRGPINAPKDGLYPLESLVDASLLPGAIAVHWQFTRPHQTVYFAAGEPFATLLLYAQTGLKNMRVEMIELDDCEDAYAQAFAEATQAPALHHLFHRLGAGPS